jgi:hypothetical protein
VPRLDTILRLVAGLVVTNCDLIAWMWWDPATHEHFDCPSEPAGGQEAWDFDVPARFRVSPVGYESRERFKDRLRRREEDPDQRAVLELLRDDAPKVTPRPRPEAAWVLRTGQTLRSLREERGLTHELAKRAWTTATFIGELEDGTVALAAKDRRVTRVAAVRIDDDLKDEVDAIPRADGVSTAEVVRAALYRYVADRRCDRNFELAYAISWRRTPNL